ncbi:hypothetical protein FHT13_002387 [Xanthomonas arboricola]
MYPSNQENAYGFSNISQQPDQRCCHAVQRQGHWRGACNGDGHDLPEHGAFDRHPVSERGIGATAANTLSQAATNQGVMQIYSLDTTASAADVEKVAQAGVADNLTSLLTVLNAFNTGK